MTDARSDGAHGQAETLWEQWARVPDATKQWLWLNDRMLVPVAIWDSLSAARVSMWGKYRGDGFWELTSDAWEFVRQQRPPAQ